LNFDKKWRQIVPIISFSGVDGSGKGANIDLLANLLVEQGLKTRILSGRFGYTPLFLKFKYALSSLHGGRKAELSQFKKSNLLFKRRGVLWKMISCLDYFLYYGVYARALNLAGFYVVIDRYIIDMRVDMTIACNQPLAIDKAVILFLRVVLPKPNLSFFLLINSSCSEERSRIKDDAFSEDRDLIRKRIMLYTEMLSDEKVIDASDDIEIVSSRISSEVLTWRD
jgi:thymidylate kinase